MAINWILSPRTLVGAVALVLGCGSGGSPPAQRDTPAGPRPQSEAPAEVPPPPRSAPVAGPHAARSAPSPDRDTSPPHATGPATEVAHLGPTTTGPEPSVRSTAEPGAAPQASTPPATPRPRKTRRRRSKKRDRKIAVQHTDDPLGGL